MKILNKLSAAEYDETTWSARTWLTFAMQRISVAVHKAVAKELSDALGFSGARLTRAGCRATELLGSELLNDANCD